MSRNTTSPPPDGVGHHFWVISDEAAIRRITELFAAMPALYIADGHHRSAAAALVGDEKRRQTRTTGAMRNTTTSWPCASPTTS